MRDGSSAHSRPLTAGVAVPHLRLIIDVELEGQTGFRFDWVDANSYAVKKRCWDWARTRPGLMDAFEQLLSCVERRAA